MGRKEVELRIKRRRKRKKRNRITVLLVLLIVLFGVSLHKVFDNKLLANKNNENFTGNIEKKDEDLDKKNEKLNEDENSDDKNKSEVNKKEEHKEIEVKKSYYIPLENDPNADDAKVVENMLKTWNYSREDGKKVVYLTFDDGPSHYVTNQILDILKLNDIKATFFMLGSAIEENESSIETVRRLAEEGHAIGNHSFTHRYDVLYPNRIVNPEAFMNEIHQTERALKNVLGEDFKTRVIRFPGGHMSWKTAPIDSILKTEGYVSIDWNTLNGDSEGVNINSEQLFERLQGTIGDLYGNNNILIILMHDTDQKETTAQYLQNAIDYLKGLGYEFRTLK